MQLRGPALNGRKVKESLEQVSSDRKRSGSKLSGFGNTVLSRWSKNVWITAVVWAGSVPPAAKSEREVGFECIYSHDRISSVLL